jgi:dynactin complex subunit
MPERSQYKPPQLSELISELEEVECQLEMNDEDENQIERFFRRDELLERQDRLQAQINELRSDVV